MDPRQPVLIIDPECNRGQLLVRRLRREGWAASAVSSFDELGTAELVEQPMVLCDLGLMCGPAHERLSSVMGHFARGTEYWCNECGRRVREIVSGRGRPVCCGVEMASGAIAPEGEKERE